MTSQVAHAAFPHGNPYLTLRDEMGVIFADDDFAHLYPEVGQPSLPPWQLALVTVLQFRENYRTAKPQNKCGHASTGSICWGWN
jgi:transposase